jgi:hypothetical protein
MLISRSVRSGLVPICACAALAACQKPVDEAAGLEARALAASALDLTVVAVSVPPRVAPGRTLEVSLSVKNTGTTTWNPGDVVLKYAGDGPFSGADLVVRTTVRPNRSSPLQKRPSEQVTSVVAVMLGPSAVPAYAARHARA